MAKLSLADFVKANQKDHKLLNEDGTVFGEVTIRFVAPEVIIELLQKHGKDDAVAAGEISVDPKENLSYINELVKEMLVEPALEKAEDAVVLGRHRFEIFNEGIAFSGLVKKGTPADATFRPSGNESGSASGGEVA